MVYPSVGVVVTTYNRSDALLAVLQGLVRQRVPACEVVVADDGSRPEHQISLQQSELARRLRLTHVWHPDAGFTAGQIRNRGVAATTAEYLIFMDGDCVPEADFIANHLRLAERGCFVNGSRVLLGPELSARVLQGQEQVMNRSAAYWLYQRARGQANKGLTRLRVPDGRFRRQEGFSWRAIRSCNMAVWRTDFEEVDGFDETYVGWGHEDSDFVLRLHHAGLVRKNGFWATEVYHLWHAEANRHQESANARLLQSRMGSAMVRAATGYAQCRRDPAVVKTTLG